MLILVILLPFLAFLSGFFFGRFNSKGICFITTLCVISSFLISLNLFIFILNTGACIKVTLFPWIFSDTLIINWDFCFDSLTVTMLLVVTFISSLVHLYSIEYMSEDPHLVRFMSYLSLFTFFMLILVTSNNFLQMFVGWEGVGLSSYLLINFWFTRIQANKSSIKAMVLNRIGDLFILIAIFTIYFVCNSLDFDVVFNLSTILKLYYIQISVLKISVLDFICLCLFLGATGKSAQLGLHTWLPDAMEGPTPVSALIHAATMVTAGVFLVIRCSFLFEQSQIILNLIVIIGAVTALFAATTGLFQNDIKRIIAYSTCSQLGYMFFACGLSSYDVGLFHLYNHAFFKALLFLGAGSVIHALSDEQDIRKMGGLRQILPLSYSIMLIGSLALTGFPFLAGFYSKDVILEIAYSKYNFYGHFAYYLGVLAAFCTAYYSTRILILVFLVNANGFKNKILHAHEVSFFLSAPLIILSILSIVIGYLSKEFFIGFGTNFWSNAIFILPRNYYLVDIEFINLFFKLLPLIFTLIGIFYALYIYFFGLEFYYIIKQNKIFKLFYIFLNRKWYFDKIYMSVIGTFIIKLSYIFSYKDIDRGLLEKIGPFGIINLIQYHSLVFKKTQTGYIYHYLFLLVFLILVFIFSLVMLESFKSSFNTIIFLLFFSLFF